MSKIIIRLAWLLAMLVGSLTIPGTAFATPATASNDIDMTASAPEYCDQFIETGAEVCFPTARELKSYEAAAALRPLVTMFRDIGWSGGYRNFVSAYGRETCTSPLTPNEASSGNLTPLQWSNGGTLSRTISSYAILPGSGCRVTLYSQINFEGAWMRSSGSCEDLRWCFILDDWNDRARSFSVS
jgi:hypothetical protein